MRHEIYFDEGKDIIVMRVKGEFNLQDAMGTVDKMDELGKDRKTILVMAGMREAPSSTRMYES
jgi:hypothetical protein